MTGRKREGKKSQHFESHLTPEILSLHPFQVYKILVRRAPDESWVVFRRYTDFSRLNNKVRRKWLESGDGKMIHCLCLIQFLSFCYVCVWQLKEMFPKFKLSLPPKRRFKDNYDMNFLEERQVGLQAFLQNLVAQKDMTERYSRVCAAPKTDKIHVLYTCDCVDSGCQMLYHC